MPYSSALMRNWGQRRIDALRQAIEEYLVVPYSSDIVEQFASTRAYRSRIGRPLEVGDAGIAATALSLDCPVVTNNLSDFSDIPGLTVLSAGAQ